MVYVLRKMTSRKRGRPSKGEEALSQAERNERYRTKNLKECRERDALQKQHARAVAALNPVANESRLKEQAAAKRLQRQRRKEREEAAKGII